MATSHLVRDCRLYLERASQFADPDKGNTQGNIILFEPTTSEHISARTIDQIAVTALAPAADCRTFAIGCVNSHFLE